METAQIVMWVAVGIYGLGVVFTWAVLVLFGMAGAALGRGQTSWTWSGVGLGFWMGLWWPVAWLRAGMG